ncbi:aminotransferase class I/II-fold pyridoxal phosphate-dependent enzyme [Longimicrobium terrae]|uniref:Alanine-synthesizing transaminase n=1 Tax=Longimicrobium terrae TaxID=1639882 RepID=A0A841GU05_9BACT|nr:aminotransferase class I/II-fold pyridoxal phosphate-dependent enzyme [Longimicrobium terrae]MBB4634666.1 alanine-synthesizing transaminase [Longimicrobium terrae]MBB6068444.1 alanine-synthesizing transaminase [Longimicrobium terrae]NNC32726.1 aminotransferase class I/II-fold pyridoxal phosphate-dependent enzyme [Longimicrobium terrae]
MSVPSSSSTSAPAWPPTSSAAFSRIGSLPAYVFAQINAEKRDRMDAGEDVIDLGMGNPDLGTPGHIVAELVAHAGDPQHHRYSASRGIYGLREGIANHYREKYKVELDPESEVVVTIGAKEGIAHLMLAILGDGDTVLVPVPAYPIHTYSVVFAGGRVHTLPLTDGGEGYVDADALFASVEEACSTAENPPKVLVLSFPNNPTTLQAPAGFFERAVEVCRRNRLLLIHDFAYADFGFGEDPPSVLAVPGARDIAVEFFSMSKSYCMAGWRVGFCVGNAAMVGALTKIKSYLDYGIFQPIQIAAAHALSAGQECVGETREVYRRRADALVKGLHAAGWPVTAPRATMFIWAAIPEAFRGVSSIEFARFLLAEAGVVVSPGVGFGPEGEGHVRFALIEPESRLAEAAERIARALSRGPASV